MAARCPSCGSAIANVDLVGPHIGNSVFGPFMSGYLAVCPLTTCRAVLGVIPDPHAIAAEAAKLILGKKR